MARHRRSESAVLLSSSGTPRSSLVELLGTIRLQPEPGYAEPLQIPGSATIDTEDSAGLVTERVNGGLVLFDPRGMPLREIASYSLVPAVDGRYEIHSGVVTQGDEAADVFAISDVVETAIAGMVLAACLLIYAGDFWLIKTTIDDYRRQGLVPEWHRRTSLLSAVTCRFDVDIVAKNASGKVIESKTVHVGRKKK